MDRGRVLRGFAASLIVVSVAAACGGCGGDDETGQEGAATDVAADVPDATGADDGIDAADVTASAQVTSTDSADDSSGASSGGATPNCDSIFSMAEIEEFFAEPVALTEETNDSLGQLVCTWESIEDPADQEDLAFKTLVVQFYSGDPIDAGNFFDPSIFESVTTIDGIGDLAYRADDLGPSFYFVDDPVGGSLSYSEVDMGNVDAPKLHTIDDVEQLFRTFHERVT